MNNLVDSHCHLNDDFFLDKVEEYILKAKNNGVRYINIVGYDLASSLKAIEIANKYDGVYASIGFHPENIEGLDISEIEKLIPLLENKKVIAIGEIGLDYHWYKDQGFRDIQKQWFIKQIEFANRFNLPISIHARDAAADTYEILKSHHCRNGGVLHCYSGSKEMLKLFANLGYYFGFDGPITYKNAVEPKECVKECSIDRILTETDSPYLSPVPFRGKPNDPSNIKFIVEQIAALKEVEVEYLSDKIEENFINLFHVK